MSVGDFVELFSHKEARIGLAATLGFATGALRPILHAKYRAGAEVRQKYAVAADGGERDPALMTQARVFKKDMQDSELRYDFVGKAPSLDGTPGYINRAINWGMTAVGVGIPAYIGQAVAETPADQFAYGATDFSIATAAHALGYTTTSGIRWKLYGEPLPKEPKKRRLRKKKSSWAGKLDFLDEPKD